MRAFLENEYLPHAREGVGLMYMKGGDALYRYEIQSTTTLPKSPQEIHALGLSEVERISRDFDKVREQVGFKGDLHAFFDYMRTSPKFAPKSREQLQGDFYRIKQAVEAKVPDYFSKVPRTQLVIRAYPAYREKFEAGGTMMREAQTGAGPAPSTSIPMICRHASLGKRRRSSSTRANRDTISRSVWRRKTIGCPISCVSGATPPSSRAGRSIRRRSVIRWASTTIPTSGSERSMTRCCAQCGSSSTPGIHSMGWTRDQSIAYMLANSGRSRTDATAEVERYIAIPSQAVAYRIGSLTIQRLRDKAKAELGPKFDIRDFHAQVLGSGALPLSILEAKIDRWIAARQAS